MIKGAVIGLGKMGLSHAAIVGAHPDVEMVGVCDTSAMVLDAFRKLTNTPVFTDYKELILTAKPDFVIIATPTPLHFPMVKFALENEVHVFCEKPFCLNTEQGKTLEHLANAKWLVNQVGYHNHFIGTFRELKKLIKEGALGEIIHFTGEAYGPVVVKDKGTSWRSKTEEGGGCLYDYASHVLNLIQEIVGKPVKARGSVMKSIYSKGVDDAVFSTLFLENGVSGNIMINWSDETYRKMSTSLTVIGKNGKIICDATEIKVYLKEPVKKINYEKGWTIRYITDFAIPVNYYLRGEEYSAQIDNFVACIKNKKHSDYNTFEMGLYTDKVIEMIVADAKSL